MAKRFRRGSFSSRFRIRPGRIGTIGVLSGDRSSEQAQLLRGLARRLEMLRA